MMKKTNNYRKCPCCPHHSKQKQNPCCCRSRKSSKSVHTFNVVKQHEDKAISIKNMINDVRSAYNSIEYIDQSLPLSTVPEYTPDYHSKVKNLGLSAARHKTIKSHQSRTTTAFNDKSKCFNDQYYPEHQFPYSYASQILDEKNIKEAHKSNQNMDPNFCYQNQIEYYVNFMQPQTINNQKIETSINKSQNLNTHSVYTRQSQQNTVLSNKLYQSNRTLQQIILKYDVLSKTNQELNQKKHQIQLECAQLKLSNESLNEQLLRCKKKMKLMIGKLQEYSEKDSKKLMGLNVSLQNEVKFLEIQRDRLSRELRIKDKREIMSDECQQNNLSPQWIAQTSNKISRIEHNISKIQQKSIDQKLQQKGSKNKNRFLAGNIDIKNQKSTNHQQLSHSRSSNLSESSDISAQQTARLGNGATAQQVKKTLINAMLSINDKLSFTHQQKFSRLILESAQSTDILTLIQIIISSIVQGTMGRMVEKVQKQITKKVQILHKKILLIPKKVSNLQISINNDRLVRGRSISMTVSATRSAIQIAKSKCKAGNDQNKQNNFRDINFKQSIQSPRCSFSNTVNQYRKNL